MAIASNLACALATLGFAYLGPVILSVDFPDRYQVGRCLSCDSFACRAPDSACCLTTLRNCSP